MKSENSFYEVMKLKTTSQLFLILNNADDYSPKAIEAIKRVISEKDLSPAEFEEYQSFASQKKADKLRKAAAPLSSPKKVYNFLLPLGGLFQLARIDKAEGYETRVNEAHIWARKGCLFYIAIFTILFILAGVFG